MSKHTSGKKNINCNYYSIINRIYSIFLGTVVIWQWLSQLPTYIRGMMYLMAIACILMVYRMLYSYIRYNE